MWYLYILKCSNNTYYTGVTTDIERRLKEHNNKQVRGSKYAKARIPVELVYQETHPDRSSAQKREYQIKQLTRVKKEELIKGGIRG